MKTIKNIALGLLVIAGGFSFTSCEDEDKNPIPELEMGGYIKFVEQPYQWTGIDVAVDNPAPAPDINNTRYNIGDDLSNGIFNGVIEDPNGNVASVEIFVEYDDADGDRTDPVPFRSTTTFPFDVSFTPADMASLFGVDVNDFEVGTIEQLANGNFLITDNDRFIFSSTVTLNDGRVYNSIRTNCDCPSPADGELIVEDPGTWNGGTIDNVILSGGDTGKNELLPANGYLVYLTPFDPSL